MRFQSLYSTVAFLFYASPRFRAVPASKTLESQEQTWKAGTGDARVLGAIVKSQQIEKKPSRPLGVAGELRDLSFMKGSVAKVTEWVKPVEE
jgi:hypothetical protein